MFYSVFKCFQVFLSVLRCLLVFVGVCRCLLGFVSGFMGFQWFLIVKAGDAFTHTRRVPTFGVSAALPTKHRRQKTGDVWLVFMCLGVLVFRCLGV